MRISFTKMNGAGNDFILIDNRRLKLTLGPKQIAALCERHSGIGADGLILLNPSRQSTVDWAWKFYNSDGSEAEMCGNGARCFAAFARKMGSFEGSLDFETLAGIVSASFQRDQVTVSLTPPGPMHLDQPLCFDEKEFRVHSVNTGVPHAVVFEEVIDGEMVGRMGAAIRHHAHFAPHGTNVNFVQVLGPGRIKVRTYERGVEAETLACGTGVTASALVAARLLGFQSPVDALVQSGDQLQVSFVERGMVHEDVRLAGPADFVFTGEIELD